MLKGRNKKFAPKVGGARRPIATPASTQSSAPPSVEPQSQTLPPTPSIEDVPPTSSEKEPVPLEAAVSVEAERARSVVDITEPEPSHQIVEKETEAQAAIPASPKRKAHDVLAFEPPAKRIPLPTSARREQSIAETSRSSPGVLDELTEDEAPTSGRIPSTSQPTPDSNVQKPADNITTSSHPDSGSAPAAKFISNAITESQPEVSRTENESEAHNYVTPTGTDVQDTDMEGDETGHSRASSPEDPLVPPRTRYLTPPGASGRSASPAPSMDDAEDPMMIRPGQMGQGSRVISMAGLNPDGTPAEPSMNPADPTTSGKGKAKRRYIMKRKKVYGQEDNDPRATIDMQLNRPKQRSGASKRRRKKGSGKERGGKRAPTPEGAEDEVVDHTVLKISELCKDLRIGKKFSRHDEIKVQYEKSKLEARLARDNPVAQESEDEIQQAPDDDPGAEEDAVPASRSGPKMIVVDGQVVVDQQSTQHDPHAAVSRDAVEVVEENDFTTLITSNSFAKKMRTQKWDELSTELFYQGLAQFGTDFEMIKKMFPHRERKSIKLKFNKEERINPGRVNRTLRGEKREIDLDWFQEKSNLKLEEVDVLNGQREEVEKEHQKRQADFRAEKAKADKEKADHINAEAGGSDRSGNRDGDAAESGNGKSKASKKGKPAAARKKKNMHSSNTEETFEVLPSIERD